MSYNTPSIPTPFFSPNPVPSQSDIMRNAQIQNLKAMLIRRIDNINREMAEFNYLKFQVQQEQVEQNKILNVYGHNISKWNPRNRMFRDYNNFMYKVYQTNDQNSLLSIQLQKDLEYIQVLQHSIDRYGY